MIFHLHLPINKDFSKQISRDKILTVRIQRIVVETPKWLSEARTYIVQIQLKGRFASLHRLWIFAKSLERRRGFPDSSVGKESTCNAGDPSLILGFGRSAAEGIGYPLQYSQAPLVAQLVKNLPAMRETWVWSLSWEHPLEKGKATHSSILAWRIPWTV